METPTHADAPRIAADENMNDGAGETFGYVANCHISIHQVLIGGNPRGIGVHRRAKDLRRHHSPTVFNFSIAAMSLERAAYQVLALIAPFTVGSARALIERLGERYL